jgi:hypothetical protein
MTVKKVKKENTSGLKTKLDDIFSLYIRLRDATDEGYVQCFTCGKVTYFQKGMQCGHFESRRTCLLGGTSKIVNRNAWGAICLPRVDSMFLV